MIKYIDLAAFGPIDKFAYDGFQNINLIIGRNGSGKTFLLKALYAGLKTVEQYQRGNEPRSHKQLLADALYWTFQGRELGNLVQKGEPNLSFCMGSDKEEKLTYSFGSKTVNTIQNLECSFLPTQVNNIFIPAKEILSIQDVILRSYEVDKAFGFDKTYVDLARALSKTVKGRNYKEFSDARKTLTDAIGGRLEFDDDSKEWIFRDDNKRIIKIALTSEGIKRLSILDLLLGNHFLTRDSVVIIDEAEANLHPSLVCKFMEILVMLAQAGLQIFLSSHSYFVIKSLYVLAHQHQMSIPTVSFEANGAVVSDLLQGMPENPIVEESNMVFSFPDEDVYRIEKSPLLAEVQLKATECVVSRQNTILFIEAKSSSPRPQPEGKFEKFIDEITDKFTHSLTFYNATILRHAGENMPDHVKNVDLSEAHYTFILVIYGHKIEWLPPLMDAIKSRLRHTLKLWNIPDVAVKVMNERMALDNQIIVGYN